MRWLCSLLLLVFGIADIGAQDATGAEAKAKAALELAKIRREAGAGAGVDSAASAKVKAICALALARTQRERETSCLHDLDEATKKAGAENRRLFIWVGTDCLEDVRRDCNDGVHVHVPTAYGSNRPRLLISTGRDSYWEIPKSEVTLERVRAVIGPKKLIQQASPVSADESLPRYELVNVAIPTQDGRYTYDMQWRQAQPAASIRSAANC